MRAGFGSCSITPAESIWMGGYIARVKPSMGVLHDLRARALMIEDDSGQASVIVSTDLLGLTRHLSDQVAAAAFQRFGIPRERLLLTSSHTHSGPVIEGCLMDMYDMPPEQIDRVRAFTAQLPEKILSAIDSARNHLEDCRLLFGAGNASFAMNRREYTADGIINGVNPIGPRDESVPVLRVERLDGSLAGVVFGYACHNTTTMSYLLNGDYAGFAEMDVEASKGNPVGMFVMGCGADINPIPRGTLEQAQHYGSLLSHVVLSLGNGDLVPVHGNVRTARREVSLPLAGLPTRDQLLEETRSDNFVVRRRAQRLLDQLERQGRLEDHHSYPVQVWSFGKGLLVIALAGEVVVDYSLRLKHEFGSANTWVIGYAEDVFAYIPSIRILREGGYEGGESMLYYGIHGSWQPHVEALILEAVREAVHEVLSSAAS